MSDIQSMISLQRKKEIINEFKRQVKGMLALTRKKGEALMINNDIEITILEVRGDQVKLGIAAPKEVTIYRQEVYAQIQEANKEASDNMAGLEQLASLLKKTEN